MLVPVRAWALLTAFACFTASVAHAESDPAKAREHFKSGTKAYDLGRYLDAAREYETAYEIHDEPALLYNIAQAYRLGGENVKAMRAYKAFLRRSPKASNRAEVEQRIVELQRVVGEQNRVRDAAPTGTITPEARPESPRPVEEPAPAPAAPAPKPAATVAAKPATVDTGKTLRVAGLALLGTGLGFVVVGGAFAGLTKKADDEAVRPADGVYNPDADARAATYQGVSIATLAVGGIAVIAGVSLYVVGRKRAPAPASASTGLLTVGTF